MSRIRRGPLLLDAAHGTRLVAQGLDLARSDPCLWNLDRPAAVLDLHRRDVQAGAEAVFTNTFGANRGWLTRLGRDQDAAAINRAGVRLAREAIGTLGFVIGSIGPTVAENESWLRDQADLLVDAGVDALVLETFRFDQAITALGWLDSVRPARLVGLYAWPIDDIGATANRLTDSGASVVGANCFTDLALADRFLDAIEAAGDLIGWLKPAASGPGGSSLTPADFACLARRLAAAGTGLLGGCCGTTEAHLAAIRAAWDG